jgi:hypothetical protein
MSQQTLWQFSIAPKGEEDAGTLTVRQGTGRWSQTLNTKTGEIGEGVYAYDATWETPDGQRTDTFVTQATLRQLRRRAAPLKLTPAQQRALDEWKRRKPYTTYQPDWIDAVLPTRSNAEAALRRSIQALVKLGVFRELPDHRVQLVEEGEAAQ